MKREEIEKQNEAAIRLAKQKKQMEIDELEEDHRNGWQRPLCKNLNCWTPFLKVANLKQLQLLGAQWEMNRLSKTGSTPQLL